MEGASNLENSFASELLTEEDIFAAFNIIDTNNDGYLSKEELIEGLKALHLRQTEEEVDQLFSSLQGDEKEQNISLEQFSVFVREREEKLAAVFNEMDTNKDGFLDEHELATALKKIGLEPTRKDILSLIEELDLNNDGEVEFFEFRKLFLLCVEVSVENIFRAWRTSIDAGIDKGEATYSQPPSNSSNEAAWKILVAGGISGSISRTCTAPFDRLKVLLQAGGKINGQEVSGILTGLKSIYRERGWRGFFIGNGTNVLKIAPESAVKFFAYERFKVLVAKDPTKLSHGERFIAGALAGVTAQTAIYPMEVTKTRLAVSPPGTYKGIADCISKVFTKEGPRALFRGLGTSVSGIIPYSGVDMCIFFGLKEAWVKKNPNETPGVLALLLMGATSSVCGQITAYPLQLVRTRLQAQGTPGNSAHYDGMRDCFKQVYNEAGIRGFYRGIAPNFMKAIPAISISYVVYEKTRELLTKF